MHFPHRAPLAGVATTAMAAAAVAVPLAGGASAAVQPVPQAPVRTEAAVQEAGEVHVAVMAAAAVTVRQGDTLAALSAKLCGTPGDYQALAYNNKIDDPDMIVPGEVIKAACHAAASALAKAYPAPAAPVAAPAGRAPAAQPQAREATVSYSGAYGCAALEALWREAGGASGSAEIAASVAMAESGGNPNAISPTNDYGLWQVNGSNGALATLSPSGSAHSAVVLSDDGANWGPWTTYTSGAYAGRC